MARRRREVPPLDPESWAAILEEHLEDQILRPWFPKCLDEAYGGFQQSYLRDWREGPAEPKSLVFQARMTWVAATVARHRPRLRRTYHAYALHGLNFLREALWDREYGGFFWSEERPDEKHMYGMAFGILATAAVYRVTGDPAALTLAKDAFHWSEEHAHDVSGLGFREALNRDGTPLADKEVPGKHDLIGTPLGQRSSNTHLHLLEAFVELYKAWPDPSVERQIQELAKLVERVLPDGSSSVPKTFSPAWEPSDTTSSYGHDLEFASWLVEAAEALGEAGELDPWPLAGRLTHNALEYGFDRHHGGFFLEGPPGQPAMRREKIWWVQAEALCTLSMFHRRSGGESADYLARFRHTWSFLTAHILDRRFGEWFGAVSENGRRRLDKRKGHAWKTAYHGTRALLTSSQAFRAEEVGDAGG
jgi:mannobiose 2-epimerase